MSIPEELKHLNWVWLDDRDHPTYGVAVDHPGAATFVTGWFLPDAQRVGFLGTRHSYTIEGENYLLIGAVNVSSSHRDRGIATLMYRALINNLGPDFVGIASWLPDRVQRRYIPRIWSRFGGEQIGDYEVIRKSTLGTTGALIPPTPPDVRYEFMPDCRPDVPEENYPASVIQLLERFEDGRALTMAALLGIQIWNPYITANMSEVQQAQYYRVTEIAYEFLNQEPENWEVLQEEMREALQGLMTSMWHTSTPWSVRNLARAPASLIEDYGFYYSGDWSFELLREVTDEYVCRIVPQRSAFDYPTLEFIRRWWELIVCTFPIREGVVVRLD